MQFLYVTQMSKRRKKKVKEKDWFPSRKAERERERERKRERSEEESGEQARKIKQRNVCLTLFFLYYCVL
jgi:hypothetical protein